MRKTSLILLLFISSIGTATIEAQEYKYELGISLGPIGYLGDANPQIPFSTLGVGALVQARYNINFRMVAHLSVGYQLFRGKTKLQDTRFPSDPTLKFSTSTILLNPTFEYNFFPYSDKYPFLQTRRMTPYISLGMALGLGFKQAGGVFFMPGLTGAIGLKYKVANRWNLQLQLGGMHFFTDALESGGKSANTLNNPYGVAQRPWKGNDGAVAILMGISYEFGAKTVECRKL